MFTCNGGDNQKWDWDPISQTIRSTGAWSNICLQEDLLAVKGGACSGAQEFVWTLDKQAENTYKLLQPRDGLFGKCVDMRTDTFDVYMGDCHSGSNHSNDSL